MTYLTKYINHLKDDVKSRTPQVDGLIEQLVEIKNKKEAYESHLSEMNKQKEITEAKCSEWEATNAYMVHEAEYARVFNNNLK